MLRVWGLNQFRPTMDIDLLGQTDNELGMVIDIVRDICSTPVEVDGLQFDLDVIHIIYLRFGFQ